MDNSKNPMKRTTYTPSGIFIKLGSSDRRSKIWQVTDFQNHYLPFKLIGLTEKDLYNEIAIIENMDSEFVSIPSDIDSDNDRCNGNDNVDEPEITNNLSEPDNMVISLSDEEPEEWDPEDLFSLSELKTLFKIQWNKIVEHMVFQTNLYAEQTFHNSGKSYKSTDSVDIGINLLMGIKKLPSYWDYWSTDPILHNPYISRLITVHRFGWLLSNKCSLHPHEFLSVDESMIKFKGRSMIKQYMPAKPVKRGYKVWMIADSTGYCWDFKKYCGKTGPVAEKCLGTKVLQKIFFDNFFTNVALMNQLYQEKLLLDIPEKYAPISGR
ncbi:uncharacterized protein LOC126734226 [Anthonomus grandis grandis]|uniref:uncharacterized protein LOC126734226 n=1 Tax=Anthonomus grandis grandis TaxID=2921223 RepID=UPI002166892A|nr:uncharacterized protein LOC126734226 [Anthonomus grandis grandis]